MAVINPYLSFNGKAEDAFNFYKSVFGGELASFMRWKDNPQCPDMSEQDRNRVMHVTLPIGNGNVLMASDSLESMGQKLIEGNNFRIALGPESKEEADRLFKGLSAGGEVEMEMQDMFWGGYYGSFTDKFGIQWMVNYTKNQQQSAG